MGTPKEKGWYTMKVYEKLAMCANALRNSREKNNQEWVDKHEEDMAKYLYEYLPSGSGIDNGMFFSHLQSDDNKMVICSSFHVLDENGYYDGWIDFAVEIYPAFVGGIDLKIEGNFTNRVNFVRKDASDIKEYLYEVFYDALVQEICKKN